MVSSSYHHLGHFLPQIRSFVDDSWDVPFVVDDGADWLCCHSVYFHPGRGTRAEIGHSDSAAVDWVSAPDHQLPLNSMLLLPVVAVAHLRYHRGNLYVDAAPMALVVVADAATDLLLVVVVLLPAPLVHPQMLLMPLNHPTYPAAHPDSMFPPSATANWREADVPMALFPNFAYHVYEVQYFSVLTVPEIHPICRE